MADYRNHITINREAIKKVGISSYQEYSDFIKSLNEDPKKNLLEYWRIIDYVTDLMRVPNGSIMFNTELLQTYKQEMTEEETRNAMDNNIRRNTTIYAC